MSKLTAFLDRYLDQSEQLADILFGLIMVLTFTLGARSTIAEGREATRTLLLQALGCNVAWGIISGMLFLMNVLFERSQQARLILAVQRANDEAQALGIVREELDEDLEAVAGPEERTRLYAHIVSKVKSAEPRKLRIDRDDLIGAFIIFFLVCLTALPAILPFLFITDLLLALRVSNLLMVSLLFFAGFCAGRISNVNPWFAGLAMTIIGLAAVGTAELLGG